MTRVRIPQESRIRAELQKEIGSRCPVCKSEEVGHFEIHHIDGNNSNNIIGNLLLLCRECHSKFTKQEWDLSKGVQTKLKLTHDINYLLFQSVPDGCFDYTCYNMQTINGRLPDNNSNGSVANVSVIDRYHFKIMLQQDDGRIWSGTLNLHDNLYGHLTIKYQGDEQFETTRRECYLTQQQINGFREDSFLCKPLSDFKDYGHELIKRKHSHILIAPNICI